MDNIVPLAPTDTMLSTPAPAPKGISKNAGEVAAVTSLTKDVQAYNSDLYEMQASGVDNVLKNKSAQSVVNRKEAIERNWPNTVQTQSSDEAMKQATEYDALRTIIGEDNYPEHLGLYDALDAIKDRPDSGDDVFRRNQNANELALQAYAYQRIADLEAQAADHPITNFLWNMEHMIVDWVAGAENQDLMQSLKGVYDNYSVGTGVKTYFNREGFVKDFYKILKDIPENKIIDVLKQIDKNMPAHVSERDAQLWQMLLNPHSDESGTSDALWQFIPPVVPSVGQVTGVNKAILGTIRRAMTAAHSLVKPGKALNVIAQESKQAAGNIVSESIGKETAAGQAVVNSGDAVKYAVSTGKTTNEAIMSTVAPEVRKKAEQDLTRLTRELDGVVPKTLTHEQQAKEAEDMVRELSRVDPTIAHLDIIGFDDNGMKLAATRSNYGKEFLDVESAHKFAKENGIANYTVIPAVKDLELGVSSSLSYRLAPKAEMAQSTIARELLRHPEIAAAYAPHLLNTAQFKNVLKGLEGEVEQIRAIGDAGDIFSQEFLNAYDRLVAATNKATFNPAKHIEDLTVLGGRLGDMLPSKLVNPRAPKLFQEQRVKVGGFALKNKNLHIGHDFEAMQPDVAKAVDKAMTKVGMESKVIYATEKDLLDIAKTDSTFSNHVTRLLEVDMGTGTSTSGWATRFVHPEYGKTTLIVVKDNLPGMSAKTRLQIAATSFHELGHAFVYEFLHSSNGEKLFRAMQKDYIKWLKSADGIEFLSSYDVSRALPALSLDNKFATRTIWDSVDMRKSAQAILRELEAKGHNMAWFKDTEGGARAFEEFFVDNFAKELLGKPDIRIAFFQKLADMIKEAYNAFKEAFGKTAEAFPTFKEFLDRHIADIADGKATKAAPDSYLHRSRLTDAVEHSTGFTNLESKSPTAASTKYLIQEAPVHYDYLHTDAGVHDPASIKGASWLRYVVDPKQKITRFTYANSLAAMFATSRESKAMVSYLKEGTKNLSAKEQRHVWDTMVEIDSMSNQGERLTDLVVDESFLRARGFNDNQLNMYTHVRHVRDLLWAKHDRLMLTELRSKGFTARIAFTDKMLGEVNNAGKIYKDSKVIKSLVSSGEIKKIYDVTKGGHIVPTAAEIDAILARGDSIVRLRKPVNGVEHVVVSGSAGHIKPLNNVLPYRPHEFSRVYSEPYFLTYKTMDEIDGVARESTHTFRTAASSREAIKYTESLSKALAYAKEAQKGTITWENAKPLINESLKEFGKSGEEFIASLEKGEIPMDASFSYHFDRVKEDALASVVDEHIYSGRMFESKRGKKLLSVESDRVNTASPIESLGIEMSMIAKKTNLSAWRKAAINKYLNTFVDKVVRTGNDLEDFMKAPISAPMGSKAYEVAKNERDYIMSMVNGRTLQERVDAAKARQVVEWAESLPKVGGVAEKIFTGMQLRKANPIQFLRTINFHLSLGMFNPSQILVQSLGMMNSVYIHPVHGMKAAMTAIPLRLALMSDNPEVWRKLAALSKLSMPAEDFEKVVRGVKDSGILSNVHNTALYNAGDGFDNMFKEYGKGTFSKASTMFFDRGEEFSRLVSWDVARREWMKLNPKADWTTNAALNEITTRMDDYTMGMTHANVANYQRGLLSIPAQFLQYNIKLATEVARGAFGKSRVLTRADATKIILGNIIMFGTAGNGLRGWGDEWFGEHLDNDQKLALTEGALSALINVLSGGEMKLATGQRYGTFNWYRETAENIWTGNMDVPDLMFGVTKSNLTKGIDLFSDMMAIWHPVNTMSTEQVGESMKILASMSGGMSNAVKAWVLTQNGGRLYTKRGDLLTTVTQQEAFAQLLGIPVAEIPDYYYTLGVLRKDSDNLAEMTNHYKHLSAKYLEALSNGDYNLADSYRNAANMILSEDPMKAMSILRSAKGSGGIELTESIKMKLLRRGIEQPVTVEGE